MISSLAVLATGIGAAVAARAIAVARPKAFHRPHHVLTWAIVAVSSVGAALADVSPTGIDTVDLAYRMGFAAVVTLAAGRAKRHARLIAGACAAIGSVGTFTWNLVAFAALGLATGSSATVRRPARPLGTAIGTGRHVLGDQGAGTHHSVIADGQSLQHSRAGPDHRPGSDVRITADNSSGEHAAHRADHHVVTDRAQLAHMSVGSDLDIRRQRGPREHDSAVADTATGAHDRGWMHDRR